MALVVLVFPTNGNVTNAVWGIFTYFVTPTPFLQVKAGSVKQEFEKQEELRRSAMRAVAALLSIREVEKSPIMADFTNQIRSNAEMATIFESVQGDAVSGGMEAMDTS